MSQFYQLFQNGSVFFHTPRKETNTVSIFHVYCDFDASLNQLPELLKKKSFAASYDLLII